MLVKQAAPRPAHRGQTYPFKRYALPWLFFTPASGPKKSCSISANILKTRAQSILGQKWHYIP